MVLLIVNILDIVFLISPSFLHLSHSFLFSLGRAIVYLYFVVIPQSILRFSTNILIKDIIPYFVNSKSSPPSEEGNSIASSPFCIVCKA